MSPIAEITLYRGASKEANEKKYCVINFKRQTVAVISYFRTIIL